MEITYVIAGFMVLVMVAYVHQRNIFAFARRGEDYMQSLIDDPKQYSNDPDVLNALKNRDLPRLQGFLSLEPRLRNILIVAQIVNIVGIYYPQDALFGHWLGWILLLLLTIVNLDVILTFFHLRHNKQVASKLCNGYYNIVQQYALEEQRYIDMADKINAAFHDLEKNIKKIKTEVDKDAKDE